VQENVPSSIQDKPGISSSWLLLDSQSTMDVFCNPKLLSNIPVAKRTSTLCCNAGRAIINKKGDLGAMVQSGIIQKISQTFCLYTMCKN